jgi:hypothetical protein
MKLKAEEKESQEVLWISAIKVVLISLALSQLLLLPIGSRTSNEPWSAS